ncbi:hypothetical protein HDU76_013702 [Blyttiomyces sp. JEL0837]|nr:hypothetical protein HDU76_013702 [Blyttiomyces sp. JEL0837]
MSCSSDKKCSTCGWGLPLIRKRKVDSLGGDDSERPTRRARSVEDSNSQGGQVSPAGQDDSNNSNNHNNISAPAAKEGKSWKFIYAERLVVERNWRRAKYDIKEIKGHTDGIMCLYFDDSLSLLATGSYDHSIRIWNVDTGECVKVLTGHTRCIRGIQFDENKLVSGSLDRTIRIWNMKTFECIRTLEGHNEGVVCVHFDDKLLASGSSDATIRVWNISTGKCFTLRGHTDWVNKVTIYQKNKLFSCSDDHTIKLWDLETKQVLRTFIGHNDQVQDLQLSLPHTRNPRASSASRAGIPKLVSASLDKTIKIWSIDSGECLKTLFGHEEGVWCVSSDTLRIVSGAHDKKLNLWDLESGTIIGEVVTRGDGVKISRSKPMRNILNRLISNGEFEAIVFGDKVLLDEDVDHWPTCDFLISFFSTGFPLAKAIDYVNLRKPYCVNNLPMQQVLMDRRFVLKILDYIGVRTPQRLVSSDGSRPDLPPVLLEMIKDHIDVNVLMSADETSGLVTQLDPDTIRVKDQILHKPFVEKPVSGEDHNIYIYYHSAQGGGVRKLFRKVGNKSSEFVPGVSAIRTDGAYVYEQFMNVDNAEDVKVYTIGPGFAHAETRKSPVVDGVVRRNTEGKEVRYITALSEEEKEISRKVSQAFGQTVCGFDLLRVNGKSYVIDVNGWSFVKGNDEYYDKCAQILRSLFLEVSKKLSAEKPAANVENQWKLKAFLSVLRHGDRTPKQKAKFNFRSRPFLDLLSKDDEESVLKNDKLKMVTAACNQAIKENLEDPAALESLRTIMELKSELPGTKVQVKPSFHKIEKTLEKVQLVVKWGGEFTHGGKHQSRDLGENLRKDLRIINKALLDDIRIYSSSERRVLATADIFAKALLDIKDIPEELITVNKEMLDDNNAAKEQMETVKSRLQAILNPNEPVKLPIHYLPEEIEDPELFLQDIIDLLSKLRTIMRANFDESDDLTHLQERWCCAESPYLFRERWEKLFKEFCDVDRNAFEPSKISELYDSLKYDLLHNREFCEAIFASPEFGRDLLRQLYGKAKTLFDFVAPQEYGIDNKEKLEIGILSSQGLLKQLVDDLQAAKASPVPCTRLYFTKESKLICLFNIVLLCGLPTKLKSDEVDELDYLTQITFELHERTSIRGQGEREYSLRIGFSPGAHDPNLIDLTLDGRHCLSVAPRKWISGHVPLSEALTYLSRK